MKFHIGDTVEKVGGDYKFSGTVIANFKKLSGVVRYIVENDDGVLHIYNGKNLEIQEYETPLAIF